MPPHQLAKNDNIKKTCQSWTPSEFAPVGNSGSCAEEYIFIRPFVFRKGSLLTDITTRLAFRKSLEPSHGVIQSLKKNFYSVLILHLLKPLFSIFVFQALSFFCFS